MGDLRFFIVPEIGDTEEILRQMAGKRLGRRLKGATPNSAAHILTQEQVNQMIEKCFTSCYRFG